MKTFFKWQASEGEQAKRQESHVVQMIENAHKVAKVFGNIILLLDRYFLSVKALRKLKELNEKNRHVMDIVTKAKKSCTAYETPIKKDGRGRPSKKGGTIKMQELFKTKKEAFKSAQILMYGNEETVSYYCVNLLWGQKLYQELRFVLVIYQGRQSVLNMGKLHYRFLIRVENEQTRAFYEEEKRQ